MRPFETSDLDNSPALQADAVMELETILGDSLETSLGLAPSVSHDLATKMVRVMRIKHPGTRVYIAAPSKEERDAAIRADLRPGNAAEVAAKWDLSISAVYKIANKRTC